MRLLVNLGQIINETLASICRTPEYLSSLLIGDMVSAANVHPIATIMIQPIPKRRAYLMLIVVMLLWASGIIVARSVHEQVAPIGFSFWRWFGMCQPVLDSYFKVNVFLTAPAALRVGKLTWSTLVPRSSGLIGLIATQSGGIGTRGRPRTKRSGC
jgi:hypothetical protein